MILPVDYPLCVLTPTDISIAPNYLNQEPQAATNGMRRSVGMAGAQFRLSMSGITLHNADGLRTLRAFAGAIEGDRNLVRIRFPDLYGADGPWSNATAASRRAHPKGVPFATGAMYATGAGHAVPTLDAVILDDADISSRELIVRESVPAGVYVSIADFCYTIAGSWTEDGVTRVKLSPPLRTAVAAGDLISLAPIFIGSCITALPGSEALRYGRYGGFALEFVEDLTRLVEDVD